MARDRRGDGFRRRLPARLAAAALFRVLAFALEGGGGSLTPARRAFDRPMAIACLVERAPCLPSRTCSISSCTNSPAWLLGALPARLAARAFFMVLFSGIASSSVYLRAVPQGRGCGPARAHQAIGGPRRNDSASFVHRGV